MAATTLRKTIAVLPGDGIGNEVMAQALLDWETLESDQISQIMSGESPRPPSPPDDGADSGQVGGDGEKDQKPEVGPSVESPAGGSA